MTKRRTRRDKEIAKHRFLISWSPGKETSVLEANVKGQLGKDSVSRNKPVSQVESAILLAKETSTKAIKKDLLKSLILFCLILGLEIVIFLAGNVRWNINIP